MTVSTAPTFDDEFDSLNLWNGTSGTWDTTAQFASTYGNGYSLPSNGEQEWYINSNYAPTSSVQPWTVNNGVLTLSAAPASSSISSQIDGYQYTSGQINTSQSFSQTYGYFEMRAELPAGQGTWPAFWLLPENGSWPPEIDAMEMLGNNPATYYTSIHSGSAANEINAGQGDTVADTSSGYHTYGVDWEPDHITYYFDGQEVYQTATPADMNTPMYMIANLALGGPWGGNVDGTTSFPANMNIDWIRAYASLPSWVADGSDGADINHTGSSTTGTSDASSAASSTSDGSTNTAASDTSSAGGTQTATAGNGGNTIASTDHVSALIGTTGNDTFIAGHVADTMTGNGGSDTFVFNVLPWNAGHITDFNPATDKLDLSGVLHAVGYSGTNPVADGYLAFVSDGAGDTQVIINAHDPSDPWPTLITTLDHVSPDSITPADYGFGSGSDTSSTTAPGSSTAISAAGYTVPSNVTTVALTGYNAQTVTANNAGDTITSNDAGSTIIGGTGNDTLIAGHSADILTGGGGNDTFVFNDLPWNAGHITDFNPATDVLNLTGIFQTIGYWGSNPIADGYLSFVADSAGNTQVVVNAHDPANPWPTTVTTLDHVSPSSITSHDYIFQA
ncbi:MAG TPA: family 16 glycosylhydrolase [Stellaceae bacterium]|nr:family 16 glycosylhydrolase [Stellaceae bacterium]